MKQSFGKTVLQVIEKSDIILEVLDARLVDLTRNEELEEKILSMGKRIIYVVNKYDLVDSLPSLPKPSVYISSKERMGISLLREMIYSVAAKNKSEEITVGVVGYPNTGKSSVINALKGRGAAKVMSHSGTTRGVQKIRMSGRVMILDSPGVIPIAQRDEMRLALLGAKNVQSIKHPVDVAYYIISFIDVGVIEKKYDVSLSGCDDEEMLEAIAIRKGKLKKGGVADLEVVARQLIGDWQKGF